MSIIKDKALFSKAFEAANYYEAGPEVHVYSWSPGRAGSTEPSTQVHIHFGGAPGHVMVARLKSARVADELINALVTHREDVWGKRE